MFTFLFVKLNRGGGMAQWLEHLSPNKWIKCVRNNQIKTPRFFLQQEILHWILKLVGSRSGFDSD